MSISVFSVTKGGYELSKELHTKLPQAELYVSSKVGESPHYLMDGTFKTCVKEAFERDTALIFVMATGIVVRTIAPLLKHKTEDPAILVIDEKGQHVISLLSGHIGGGNRIAEEVAALIGARPVITTSSDVQDKIAIDVLALKNNLIIDSMIGAKEFASGVVNGKPLMLITDEKVKVSLDSQWRVQTLSKWENKEESDETNDLEDLHTVLISNRLTKRSITLRLIPKNIVLGIGCRRGMEKERILEAIEKAMSQLNIDGRSIKKIGTVDVKADEVGLIAASEALALPLEIIERTEIKKVEHQFGGSDFVERTIGVRAVCEPAAMLASNKEGKFLMKKTSFDGITIAVWEEIYEIR